MDSTNKKVSANGKDFSLTKSNFGGWGWYYVFLTMVLFCLQTGIVVDGLNVSIAAFCEKNGWEQATLLNYSTIAGYIAIAANIFLGWFVSKKGSRFAMAVSLFISGVTTFFWGMAQSPAQYLVCITILTAFTNCYSHLASSNLAASLSATVYGTETFAKAYGVINTVMSAVRSTAFAVLAFGLTKLGGYTGAYAVFLALTIIGTVLMVFVREKVKD